jgi:hypothetical protein
VISETALPPAPLDFSRRLPGMRDILSRPAQPALICPANPSKSKKTAADLATVFSARCYLTMDG